MKRKFKLFATVASLCLSVALMAFGVYAATSVTYNVSGTVSFSSLEVASTWTAGAYKANETDPWGETTNGSYSTTAGQAGPLTNSATFPAVAFTTTDNVVIYKITCKNDGSTPFYVHVASSGNELVDNDTKLTVEVEAGVKDAEEAVSGDIAGLTTATVGVGQTYSWIITVTYNAFTEQLTETDIALQFTANYTA